MAAFLLITTLLLVARGRDDSEYEDEEEVDVIDGSVDVDHGDDALPAPA
jgi:hypothetical protein